MQLLNGFSSPRMAWGTEGSVSLCPDRIVLTAQHESLTALQLCYSRSLTLCWIWSGFTDESDSMKFNALYATKACEYRNVKQHIAHSTVVSRKWLLFHGCIHQRKLQPLRMVSDAPLYGNKLPPPEPERVGTGDGLVLGWC